MCLVIVVIDLIKFAFNLADPVCCVYMVYFFRARLSARKFCSAGGGLGKSWPVPSAVNQIALHFGPTPPFGPRKSARSAHFPGSSAPNTWRALLPANVFLADDYYLESLN